MKKLLFAFSFMLILPVILNAQEVPSQREQIRIEIFADMDPYPGNFDEETEILPIPQTTEEKIPVSQQDPFEHAINRAREVSRYIIEGMIYGWSYDYTPSDRTRQVEEYFEIQEIQPLNLEINPITYHYPTFDESKVTVWAYCNRTDYQIHTYDQWTAIAYPKVHGKGQGQVSQGFKGIQEACSEAIKNGVREYWRLYERNKPREIIGKVLIVENPRIYVKEGKYVVELDFFMETDRIIRYNYY